MELEHIPVDKMMHSRMGYTSTMPGRLHFVPKHEKSYGSYNNLL